MRFDDIPAKDLGGADTTVIRTLGSREAVLRPAIGPALGAQQRVLLFQAEPEVVLGMGLHEQVDVVPEVEAVRLARRVPRLAHDQDVGGQADRVGEDGDGPDVDVAVVAWSLPGGGAVEVPFGELLDRGGRFLEGL